jgi:hypothetical protein
MSYLIIDVASTAIDNAAGFMEEPSAPKNYSDPVKIAAYIAEKKAERVAGRPGRVQTGRPRDGRSPARVGIGRAPVIRAFLRWTLAIALALAFIAFCIYIGATP